VVYLTSEGLQGIAFRSNGILLLSALVPIPLLAAVFLVIQQGALAVYAVAWMAATLVLYDELRWQGFRSLQSHPPSVPQPGSAPWLVPWRSLRMADWNGRTLWFTSFDPARKASVTFDRAEAPLVERSLASWGVRYLWRPPRLPRTITSFSALAVLLFVVGQLILILAATLPFFPGEEQMYNTILSGTRSQVANATFLAALKAIYLNNIQVAWGGTLPVLGQLSFGLANYNTGRVVQVIAISDNLPPSVVLLSLYLLPHTWVEESAYPIATVAGLLAVTRWRSVSPGEFARRVNWGSWKLVITMAGVALILLAAGLIETTGLYLGLGELLLWIPVALMIYMAVVWNRTTRRIKSQLGSA